MSPPGLTGAGVAPHAHTLKARRLGIVSGPEPLVFMRTDCPVCRSEGLAPRSRVLLRSKAGEAIATIVQISSSLIDRGEAGLSEAAWTKLKVRKGDEIAISHAPTLDSARALRRRVFGHRLDGQDLGPLIREIAQGRYSEVEISAFIAACATLPPDEAETLALTRAMVDAGDRLAWSAAPVLDKHSVGGLPGNRTSPIVVAIVAAHGLTIPKTSSRAITSPAGTADAMEVLTPVDLSLEDMRRVVEREHGCLAWGGAVRLSPADDTLIRVERALDVDPEGQLVASVLSKKIAAGATHCVIDMPVGPTAKVRDEEAAARLKARLERTADALDLKLDVLVTDGAQPVGRGIGPALEAADVLAVLRNEKEAPQDLRAKACRLAGRLLEIGGAAGEGEGEQAAEAAVDDGRALRKLLAICEAQGGFSEPVAAAFQRPLTAETAGRVAEIDNRRLGRLAKLAGAPDAKAAGVVLHVRLGDAVEAGEPLVTLHAETEGELEYGLEYAAANADLITVRRG